MVRSILGSVGRSYDFLALLGMLWVLVGRRFGKTWKNPFADKKMEICSELVQLGLNAYEDGDKDYDPESRSPRDVMQLCRSRHYLCRRFTWH